MKTKKFYAGLSLTFLILTGTACTQEEFNEKMATYSTNLKEYFAKGKSLEEEINQRLEGLKYE